MTVSSECDGVVHEMDVSVMKVAGTTNRLDNVSLSKIHAS